MTCPAWRGDPPSNESSGMPRHPAPLTCPECGQHFPYRPNKTFCSPTCRKASQRKKDRLRNPANAQSNAAVRRQQHEDFELADRLAETLYTIPPDQRLGWMEHVVQQARSGSSSQLRRVLTNPKLVWPSPQDRRLFFRRSPRSYCTFPQALDRYCRQIWKAGIQEVIRGAAPEPPTGEVI